ncbi:unnamed protein product, partial [Urochloa humidicola]
RNSPSLRTTSSSSPHRRRHRYILLLLAASTATSSSPLVEPSPGGARGVPASGFGALARAMSARGGTSPDPAVLPEAMAMATVADGMALEFGLWILGGAVGRGR